MNETYVALPFVQFVLSLLLTSVVIFSDPRDPRNRVFAGFLVAMAAWGITIFGMRDSFPNEAQALAWEKAALAVIPFSGILFYHFVNRYLGGRRRNGVVVGFYLVGVASAALTLAGQSVVGMETKFYGFAPDPGWAFPLMLFAAYPPAVLGVIDLTGALRRRHMPGEARSLQLLRLGALLSLAGAAFDVLPSFGVGVYPLGVVGNIGFMLLTSWAVTRYQMMRLRLLLRRGLAYTVLSSLIFAVYGVMFGLVALLARSLSITALLISAAGGVLVVAAFVQPLIVRAQTLVDRLFFRERYDHLRALMAINEQVKDITDFDGLAQSLIENVRRAMQADWVLIVLPDRSEQELVVARDSRGKAPDFAVSRTASTLVKWFERYGKPVRPADIATDPYLQAMGDRERAAIDSLQAALVVPMLAKGTLTGILLLGPKLAGSDYSGEDVDFLAAAADQAALAVESARLYALERERLEELERLDSLKSNLLLTVSHELKSPLTAIKAASELLATIDKTQNGQRDSRRARLTGALQRGVSRLERLTQESLDYATMQSAKLKLHCEDVKLEDIAAECAALFSSAIRSRRQSFTVNVNENIGRTHADQARVERILTNLLSNASKFTPLGGNIAVNIFARGEYHVVQVVDDGPGIPADEIDLVFSPYYRSKNADGRPGAGTGLGLSIARFLAELHGGRLEAESELGKGATFSLYLPREGSQPDADMEVETGQNEFELKAAPPA